MASKTINANPRFTPINFSFLGFREILLETDDDFDVIQAEAQHSLYSGNTKEYEMKLEKLTDF